MSIAPDIPSRRPHVGEIAPGHVLGRYELLLPIAAGGMAMVWAARVKGTRGFQKVVAIKTMLSNLSEDEQFEQMFLAEASLASRIRHPNVVEISDLGEQDGVLYLAMDWIDGVPLNELMKAAKSGGGVPISIAVRIVMNACAGLHAAHELRDDGRRLIGLVHRDISPQNILVTYDGVSKVVDFGVAKATAMGEGSTVAGQLKGKVSYMAPEQVRGEAIDRRVDIFAMGIVLYALTTGKHPFRRETEAATLYTIASEDSVMPPSQLIADYPPALERVVLKALAKSASQRYRTASDFLRALDQCLPASERTNTDQDVGVFISTLFGQKREERRVALLQASAAADLQSVQTATLSTPGELSPSYAQSSSLTTVGVAANLDPALTKPARGISPRAQRRRSLLLIAALGGLAVAACLALLRARALEPNTAQRAPPVAPIVEQAGHSDARIAVPIDNAIPALPPDSSVRTEIPPNEAHPPSAPRTRPLARALASATASGKPRSKSPPISKWRDDPGF